ncbi:3-deoxy-manno-octulosonate cytidylyltransferase [Rickettsiales bacterium]|nr:3-deoxy-manno-octulosonate cytidylyltransferase [Rickettsiales bacterium]
MSIKKNFLLIIPVRMASTRLPGKPLVDICGKTMIQRVYDQAVKAEIGDVLIACDGQEIANEVKKFNGNYVLTDPDLPSGTDRIFSALQKFDNNKKYDAIINLQGDLPNIDPEAIRIAANSLRDGFDMSTIASKMTKKNEILDPNIVKIAIAFDNNLKNRGQALYFSRCPIPYNKNNDGDYFHHIGIYAYTKDSLKKFISLPQSNLEKAESLEQLRALEDGMKIAVSIVDFHPLSVDTPQDLNQVINIIKN